METKVKAFSFTRESPRGADEASIMVTTPTFDLVGDRINPLGMDTIQYMKGPRSVNFGHQHHLLPVARTIALNKSAAGIRATFRWRSDEDSSKVRDAFEDNVLGASVEFTVPNPSDAVRNERGGYDFQKSVLTGWALTGNPANVEAVKSLAKTLGLWGDSRRGSSPPKPETLDAMIATLVMEPSPGKLLRVVQAFEPDAVPFVERASDAAIRRALDEIRRGGFPAFRHALRGLGWDAESYVELDGGERVTARQLQQILRELIRNRVDVGKVIARALAGAALSELRHERRGGRR